MVMKIYIGQEIKISPPYPRCCAPGCGDKIKEETCIEVTSPDGEVTYLEHICVDWFENGHPDYGCPWGRLRMEDYGR